MVALDSPGEPWELWAVLESSAVNIPYQSMYLALEPWQPWVAMVDSI